MHEVSIGPHRGRSTTTAEFPAPTGFRWILVDEYQDIGPEEYELIAALAGRTVADADTRLTIFAVGDDDQNIYAFNGSSPEFIRRFEQDYNARTSLLIENYRSSGHIIDAANAVIAPAQPRMKADHAIRRNDQRSNDAPGGIWQSLDLVSAGRAQILAPAGDAISQAQAAIAEMTRLSNLTSDWDWARCAVIAREWSYLEPIRSICEQENIPAQLANEGDLSIWHLRETQSLRHEAQRHGTALIRNGDLKAWIDRQPPGPWIDLLTQALEEHELETGGAEVPPASFIEWLAEWCRDTRRRQRGLLLLTAHRAKGLEFDHVVVLDGGWNRRSRQEDTDAPRRLYYVAMTRAKQTLTLTSKARCGGRRPRCRTRRRRWLAATAPSPSKTWTWASPAVSRPATAYIAASGSSHQGTGSKHVAATTAGNSSTAPGCQSAL